MFVWQVTETLRIVIWLIAGVGRGHKRLPWVIFSCLIFREKNTRIHFSQCQPPAYQQSLHFMVNRFEHVQKGVGGDPFTVRSKVNKFEHVWGWGLL